MSEPKPSIEEVLELSRQKLVRARSNLESLPWPDGAPPLTGLHVVAEVRSRSKEFGPRQQRALELRTLGCLERLVSLGVAEEGELRFVLLALDTFFPLFERDWELPGPTLEIEARDMAILLKLYRETLDGRPYYHPVLPWRDLAQRILEWVALLTAFGDRERVASCMELYEALKGRALGD